MIMKRLITVLKVTFLGFSILNIFLTIILLIVSAIDGENMPWEYLGFVTIYGIIISIIFGYMDRPTLEKRLLIAITICSATLFIASFLIDNQTIRMQSLYLLFGIVIGRKFVMVVDMFLSKKNP